MANTSFLWHFWHPVYADAVAGRMAPSRVYVPGVGDVDGIDGRPYLTRGFISGTDLEGGQLLPVVDLAAMLAAGADDEVRRCLTGVAAAGSKDDGLRALWRYYRHSAAQRAAKRELAATLFQGPPSVLSAVALASLCSRRAEGVAMLKELARRAPWRDLEDVAKALMWVGDTKQGRDLVASAKGSAVRAELWLAMERDPLEGTGEAGTGSDPRQLLDLALETDKADMCDDGSSQYRMAEAWARLFNDTETACRLLREAAALFGEACVPLANIATDWLKTTGNSAAAREMLRRAEGTARSTVELTLCAPYWLHLFGDAAAGRACMRRAEDRALTLDSWQCVMEKWLRSFKDQAAAQRALTRAMRRVRSTAGFLAYARLAKETGLGDTQIGRCLRKGQEAAVSVRESVECAHRSAIAGLPAEARQSFSDAVGRASHTAEYLMVAETWEAVGRTTSSLAQYWQDQVIECLRRGDAAARDRGECQLCYETACRLLSIAFDEWGETDDRDLLTGTVPRSCRALRVGRRPQGSDRP